MRYIALLRGINISGKNKISMPELKCLLSKAPSWWGSDSKDIYDNLIFAIAPHSIETDGYFRLQNEVFMRIEESYIEVFFI